MENEPFRKLALDAHEAAEADFPPEGYYLLLHQDVADQLGGFLKTWKKGLEKVTDLQTQTETRLLEQFFRTFLVELYPSPILRRSYKDCSLGPIENKMDDILSCLNSIADCCYPSLTRWHYAKRVHEAICVASAVTLQRLVKGEEKVVLSLPSPRKPVRLVCNEGKLV